MLKKISKALKVLIVVFTVIASSNFMMNSNVIKAKTSGDFSYNKLRR